MECCKGLFITVTKDSKLVTSSFWKDKENQNISPTKRIKRSSHKRPYSDLSEKITLPAVLQISR